MMLNQEAIPPKTSKKPQQSWKNPELHFNAALDSDWYKLIFNIMAQFTYASSDFFREKGFKPSLMPVTCESVSSPMGLGSDSLPVSINLFGKKVFLADSMQFQLEYLVRHHEKGVWYIMPTFRGEEHDKQHLNQFFHSEAEFEGNLEDAIALVSQYLIFCTRSILKELEPEIQKQVGDITHIQNILNLDANIPCISYIEAKELIGDTLTNFSLSSDGVETITQAGETELIKKMGGITWLTHFPAKAVPFYQAFAQDAGYALCADLLLGVGEIAGVGQRHTNGKDVLEALHIHQVEPAQYKWYIRMKKEYPLQTSGFGFGLERYILWLLKHDDIRDIHLISRLKGETFTP